MRRWRGQPRFGYGVVLALIVVTYGLALSAGGRWMLTVLVIVQSITVWQALRVSRTHPGVRVAAAAVVALAAATVAANSVREARTLLGATFFAAGLLYVIAPFAIVRDLGRRRRVDGQTLLGALAAYLLIGMAFAFVYACVAALQPGPLFGDQGDPRLPDALFFSFVTMTTTGYGNQVPAGNPAQTIAVLEALTGQLFLVTAIAKIVENWRPRAWADQASGETSFAGDDAGAAPGEEHGGNTRT